MAMALTAKQLPHIVALFPISRAAASPIGLRSSTQALPVRRRGLLLGDREIAKCQSAATEAAVDGYPAARERLQVAATALTSPTSEAQVAPHHPEAAPPMDWDDLGFGLCETDFMFVSSCEKGGEWQQGGLRPHGNLEISPAAGVLNYGQGVFEGMKAYRSSDGSVLLFRPRENAERMIESATRMCMPPPPVDHFMDAILQTVKANERWIPPAGKGSLYIRPLLIGTGPILGLAPAPSYTFLVYVSPVGNYFKGGQLTPIDLTVEEQYHRAAPGGTGAAKTISNYAPVLKTQLAAKEQGFSDVLYLDAVENKYIEEVSSCNIFTVKGKEIATPPLLGTILPGITRRSVIELGRSLGYQVEERPVTVDELLQADEVFCTGTAVVVSPVGSIKYRGDTTTYQGGEVGPTAQQLYTALTDLQMGRAPDMLGWTFIVD